MPRTIADIMRELNAALLAQRVITPDPTAPADLKPKPAAQNVYEAIDLARDGRNVDGTVARPKMSTYKVEDLNRMIAEDSSAIFVRDVPVIGTNQTIRQLVVRGCFEDALVELQLAHCTPPDAFEFDLAPGGTENLPIGEWKNAKSSLAVFLCVMGGACQTIEEAKAKTLQVTGGWRYDGTKNGRAVARRLSLEEYWALVENDRTQRSGSIGSASGEEIDTGEQLMPGSGTKGQ